MLSGSPHNKKHGALKRLAEIFNSVAKMRSESEWALNAASSLTQKNKLL